MKTSGTDPSFTPIAIIGMGTIFPNADGPSRFAGLLLNGEDAITDLPETHWATSDYYDADPARPDHVYAKRGGFISSVDFDPVAFGIPPKSLDATDTSQLLGLVAAKMALSDAGYLDSNDFDRDKTSVILGVTGTQELVIPLGSRLGHPIWRKAMEAQGLDPETISSVIATISDSYVPWKENSFPGLLGNVVAGRICNRLDFGGTNCVIDAACASSMGALNLALLELAAHRSDMVISGGVDTINDIFMHMCFSRTRILSESGDIRPFSADADGTLLGEGIGMVVLKRLEDAERDKDRIYAVIRGMGTSSDGRSQSIYAPRAEGQIKALSAAYRSAGMSPDTIELLEAHGTGTRVGDQVEVKALKMAFQSGNGDSRQSTCALGSIKSQIGHTKAAAGAAGLIKAALSLYHKTLPPTLKCDTPDPELSLDDSPFYLNGSPRPWLPRTAHPRRAGVSSFGFGGSNYHIVLEEYSSEKREILWDDTVEIFAFSGLTRDDLHRDINQLKSRPTNQTIIAFPGWPGRRAAASIRHIPAALRCRCIVHRANLS
jgi:acyl transferase domain-containing protein